MKMFLWDDQNKFACDEYGEIPLTYKPNFSFEYDELRYVENGEKWYSCNDVQTPLLSTIVAEITEGIAKLRTSYGIKVLAADKDGRFIGRVDKDDERIFHIVPESPPTLDGWRWVDDNWCQVWTVDENGVIVENGHHDVFIRPFDSVSCKFDFKNNKWVSDVCFHKLQTMTAIDTVSSLIKNLVGKQNRQKEYLIELAYNSIDTASAISDQDKDDLKTSIGILFDDLFDHSATPDDLKSISDSLDIWL